MNAYVKENVAGAVIGTNAFQVRRSPIVIGFLDDDLIREIQRRPLLTKEDAEYVRQALPDARAVALQSGFPTPSFPGSPPRGSPETPPHLSLTQGFQKPASTPG